MNEYCTIFLARAMSQDPEGLFLFTAGVRAVRRSAAAAYGGAAEPWTAGAAAESSDAERRMREASVRRRAMSDRPPRGTENE